MELGGLVLPSLRAHERRQFSRCVPRGDSRIDYIHQHDTRRAEPRGSDTVQTPVSSLANNVAEQQDRIKVDNLGN